MSEFLKFAFEVLSQVVYNLAGLLAALVKLLITGWVDYFTIFSTYFRSLSVAGKVLAVLLMLILVAIPVLGLFFLVRHWLLRRRLKGDKEDNAELYREIGRLNRQVLNLIDEKNKILALKVNTMGGTERIPYVGASALTDDVLPTVGNVSGGVPAATTNVSSAQINIASSTLSGELDAAGNAESRFPKLTLVDRRYDAYLRPEFDDAITLEQLVENYRNFACSQLNLYYTPEVIRRFVAGMASSKLFSDIDQLAEGDTFYIHVLGEVLAYQVDAVNTVLPTDTSLLQIEGEKDLVTLVTCTPFGVNTHRLLVRGHRVPYTPEQEAVAAETQKAASSWTRHYLTGLAIGLGVVAVVSGGYFIVKRRRCHA